MKIKQKEYKTIHTGTKINSLPVDTVFQFEGCYYVKTRPINLRSGLTHTAMNLEDLSTAHFQDETECRFVYPEAELDLGPPYE